MKRFLSLALALALVLTSLMVPAYAEDVADDTPAVETAVVDITSVNDGDTFAAGNNIALAADASGIENVKNIDFYANGAKLPGTIVGNRGSIVWYGAVEGVYDITTKVTYNGGATADGSEAVKLIVKPADETKIKLLWPSKELSWEKVGGGSYKETDKYAMFDNKSLEITPKGNTVGTLFTSDEPIARTWGTLAFVVYSPEEVPGLNIRRTGGTPNYTWGTGQQMVNNEFFRSPKSDSDLKVYPGYNIYVAESATYIGGKVDTNGDGVKDSYPKVWDTDGDGILDTPNQANFLDFIRFTLTGAANDNDKPIYLLGIYGITGTMVTPVATPEIADGAQAVCNKVGTYRINFNSPIYPDATKVPAKVTYDVGGVATEVEGVTYTYGTNYVDLHLPDLALETKYTVSIQPNSILSYYTEGYYAPTSSKTVDRKYVAAEDFTFSTKDTDCENATPVIKMTYPADGATCVGNTGFAAKVVAGSSAMTGVEFWKGETKLGDGIAMSDGEYWFQPETAVLTVGEANEITAKAVGTDITASATYTGATTPEYYVKGIYDNAVIVAQEESTRKITIVDAANKKGTRTSTGYVINETATDVNRIEIYEEGVLVDTLTGNENTYEIKCDTYGTHKLEVRVHDAYGVVHPFKYTYDVVDGAKHPASTNGVVDFENLSEDTNPLGLIVAENADGTLITTPSNRLTVSTETFNGSTALKLVPASSSVGDSYLQLKGAPSTTGHKVHYYEFDLSTTGSYTRSVDVSAYGYDQGTGNDRPAVNLFENKDLRNHNSERKTVKVGLVLDYNYAEGGAPTAIVYFDGKIWNTISMSKLLMDYKEKSDPVLRLYIQDNNTAAVYVDNFKYSVYGVSPEYAVKGIYDGVTMVKEAEPTRTITVVDEANVSLLPTEATEISKVELYKDDVLVDTDDDGAPYDLTLTNDAYGTYKIEVKAYDIYGKIHSFVYNDCKVVEGVVSADSVVENFDSLATETDQTKLQGTISSYNSRIAYTPVNGGVKINSTENWKEAEFKKSDSAIGRKVHYYEFDLLGGGYGPSFKVNGVQIFDLMTSPVTGAEDRSYFNTNKSTMTVVIDDNLATPIVTILVNGNEWKQVEVPKLDGGVSLVTYVHTTYGTAIDNFKYTAYDYPARFGLGEFETEIIFENTGTEEAPKYTGRKMFYPVATNMTDEAVTVRYFAAVYDAEGRLEHLYNDDNRLDDDPEGAEDYWDTSWTVTYEPGALNQESQFKFNMGASAGRSAKIFPFVITGENNALDLAPIKLYE